MVTNIPKIPEERGIDKLKAWSLRLPDELYEWLIQKAGEETARRKKRVSMNALTVDILMKAMRADKKKGGG